MCRIFVVLSFCNAVVLSIIIFIGGKQPPPKANKQSKQCLQCIVVLL